MSRNEKEQLAVFGMVAAWMFAGFIVSVLTCPMYEDSERWMIFGMEVAAVLLPAYAFMRITSFLQNRA